MNNKYVRAEQTLLDACKATLEKQGIILSAENYYAMMSTGLKNIVQWGKYVNFTNENGHRRKMKMYSPKEFMDMVCNKLIECGEDEVVYAFYSSDDGKSISRRALERCINLYSNYVASSLDEMYMVSDDDRTISIDDFSDRLKDVKFYPPSNECRRAVFNGVQGRVKCSDAKNAGMMAYSDQGKVRNNNEDSYYIGVHPNNPDFKMMLVADGMGGHARGEVASNIAAREMIKWFESLPQERFYGDSDNYLLGLVAQTAVENIHEKINSQCHGGGTTLCFALIKKDNIFIGNVGDSRGLITKDGQLVFSTQSDSLPISLGVPEPFDKFHSSNNVILNCLGGDEDKPELHYDTVTLDKNSKYNIVLCSDGVTDCLDDDVIVDTMRSGNDVSQQLVEAALSNNLSFHDELDKAKKRAGIMGRSNYRKLVNLLERKYGMDIQHDKIIHGGKDNATAVYSGEVRRGR